jgi:hypothetical protein
MLFLIICVFCSGIIVQFLPVKIWLTTQGEHTGIITASDKGGLIWKTWTIYFKTDAQSSQEDTYCVINESLIPAIREAQSAKKQVTIKYEGYFLVGNPYCGNEIAIITGIKDGGLK